MKTSTITFSNPTASRPLYTSKETSKPTLIWNSSSSLTFSFYITIVVYTTELSLRVMKNKLWELIAIRYT